MNTKNFVFGLLVLVLVSSCQKQPIDEPNKEKAEIETDIQLFSGSGSYVTYGSENGLLPDADIAFHRHLYYDETDESYFVYFELASNYQLTSNPNMSVSTEGVLTAQVVFEDKSSSSCNPTMHLEISQAWLDDNDVDLTKDLILRAAYDDGSGTPDPVDLADGNKKRKHTYSGSVVK